MKQLLEKNTGTGRGRKEDGQSIRLSSAQRQALEKVIRPSSTRLVVVAHRQGEKKGKIRARKQLRVFTRSFACGDGAVSVTYMRAPYLNLYF